MGLAVTPILGGKIIEWTRKERHGFYFLSAFYVILASVGFFLAVTLNVIDRRIGSGRLNEPNGNKKAKKDAKLK